jgi:hypothetical protein
MVALSGFFLYKTGVAQWALDSWDREDIIGA